MSPNSPMETAGVTYGSNLLASMGWVSCHGISIRLPVSLWKTTREWPNAGPPLFLSSLLPCTDKPGDLGAVGNDTHGAALYMPKPLVYRREWFQCFGAFWGTVSGLVVICGLLIHERRKNKGNRWKPRRRGGDMIPSRALTGGWFGGEARSSPSLVQLKCITYKHILTRARWNPSCEE